MRPVLRRPVRAAGPDGGHEGLDVGVLGDDRRQACCWCSTMASKEMPWAASVKPKIWPVSSLGRKPLGMIVEQVDRGHEDERIQSW